MKVTSSRRDRDVFSHPAREGLVKSSSAALKVFVTLGILGLLSPCVLAAQGMGGEGGMASAGAAAGTKPAILDGITIEQRLGAQVPLNLHFTDETGRDVTLGEYFTDRPIILNLVYYRCGMLCPEVLQGLTHSLQNVTLGLGTDYDVLTVSFDPRDTPDASVEKKRMVLAQLGRPEAASGWHFLTGAEPAIQALTQSVGFSYRWDERTQQFVHAAGIMVLTPQGRVSKYFYGIEFKPLDVRLGLVQASDNHIGSLVDTVLLFCCRYDATTGKYNWLVGRILSIGGALTLLALGTLLYKLTRDSRPGPA
jgi:protein SCO1/2